MHRGRKKGASLLSPKSARRLTAMAEKPTICKTCYWLEPSRKMSCGHPMGEAVIYDLKCLRFKPRPEVEKP